MLRYTLFALLFLLFTAYVLAQERDNDHDASASDGQSETTNATTTSDEKPPSDSSANSTSAEGAPIPEQNTTSSNTTNSGTAGAEKHESPLASVYINTAKPGLGSPITSAVFKESVLVGGFNSCTLAEGNSNQIHNVSACFQDDEYNDRLTFQIVSRLPSAVVEEAFEHTPSLELLGPSSSYADSELLDATAVLDMSTVDVVVLYKCRENANGFLSLRLSLRFTADDDSVVTLLWVKKCLSGVNNEIDFGYKLANHATGETDSHRFGTENDMPYTVVPSDKSTEVYTKLLVAGAQQVFLAPLVYSEDPAIVEVAVRGNHPSGGVLKGLEEAEFQVSYECLTGKGTSKIFASIGIPPFQNLTASWEKECGGSVPRQLSIGSTEDGSDIVDLGKATPRYMVAMNNMGTAHSDEHLHLPVNQSDWTVFLSYGSLNGAAESKDASLEIGRVHITVEQTDVLVALNPVISRKGKLGWSGIPSSNIIIREGEKVRITFRFACRKFGESRVLISLPLVHYDPLEFGIAKECDHDEAVAHRSGQWVLTVGNAFWGLVLIVVGSLALYILRSRVKPQKGFAPVPTTER